MANIKQTLGIEMKIPLSWLIGFAFLVATNLGTLIWKGSQIVSKVDELVVQTAADHVLVQGLVVLTARQTEINSTTAVRFDDATRRLNRLETAQDQQRRNPQRRSEIDAPHDALIPRPVVATSGTTGKQHP